MSEGLVRVQEIGAAQSARRSFIGGSGCPNHHGR